MGRAPQCVGRTTYKTPDLSPIIQEIVNQPGWAAGNALVLIFTDDKSNPSQGTVRRCL